MHRTLVLNATYEPLHYIDAKDALIHILAGRAELHEPHPTAQFRSVKTSWPVPAVIRLLRYVKQTRRYRDNAKLNKHNLYVRDNYTCQYCNRHVSKFEHGEYLTKDHIVPREQGGKNTWFNLVTACNTCNTTKANRTPEQAGMVLRNPPSQPVQAALAHKKQRYRRDFLRPR